MEKQIEISKEAKFDLKVQGGKLILAVTYDGAQVDAAVTVSVDGAAFLDKLAAAIPGSIDDAVIAVAKGAIAAL